MWRVIDGQYVFESAFRAEALPKLRWERGGYNCRRPANLMLSGEGAPRRIDGASVGSIFAAVIPCPLNSGCPVRVTGLFVTVQIDGDFWQGSRAAIAGLLRELAASGHPWQGEIVPHRESEAELMRSAAMRIEAIPDSLMVEDGRETVRRPEHTGVRPGVLR